MDSPIPSHQSSALRPDDHLRIGWLLLLLDDAGMHGYMMLRELQVRGLQTNPSGLYRTLRKLDHDERVQSHWTSSVAGPARRFYRLTASGRHDLQQIAARIADTRDAHDRFLQAYARSALERADPNRGVVDGSADAPAGLSALHPLRPRKRLTVAWLLLLLGGGTGHGYDLQRAFRANGLTPDPGGVYRTLKQLEGCGLVQSRWLKPAGGPARHFYRLTTSGRRSLDDIAGSIRSARDSHDAFLHAYEVAGESRGGDAADS